MKAVVINLENTYPAVRAAEDLSYMTFDSILNTGAPQVIKIKITHLKNDLLPNVYNLSFGPPKPDSDEVDDAIKIHHRDIDKVFSTIILFALIFLNANMHATIGLDGSNDVRAYFYHRMFMTNKVYLRDFFVPLGVDWYVRLLRNGVVERDNANKVFFKPKPEPFDYKRPTIDMYRYYMFHLLSS